MTIRPIDLNGVIQRTQDVGQLNRQETAKPALDQQNIQGTMARTEERISHQVSETEKSDQQEYRYDAKEKGGFAYQQSNKKKQKKEAPKAQNAVIKKGEPTGFDIKI